MEPPYLQRAKAFKSELFDSAGVEEKLLQKENEFMDLKKNMKLKVRNTQMPTTKNKNQQTGLSFIMNILRTKVKRTEYVSISKENMN